MKKTYGIVMNLKELSIWNCMEEISVSAFRNGNVKPACSLLAGRTSITCDKIQIVSVIKCKLTSQPTIERSSNEPGKQKAEACS